jgi:hypothetical protein
LSRNHVDSTSGGRDRIESGFHLLIFRKIAFCLLWGKYAAGAEYGAGEIRTPSSINVIFSFWLVPRIPMFGRKPKPSSLNS